MGVKFEECPKCHIAGRKPVFARYEDKHGFCFWCGYYEPPPKFEQMRNQFESPSPMQLPPVPEFSEFPHRSETRLAHARTEVETFPPDSFPWHLMKVRGKQILINIHRLHPKEILENEILWSDAKQWLIFPYRDPVQPNRFAAWQARQEEHTYQTEHVLNAPQIPKWLNFGAPQKLLHTLHPDTDVLVLVEDIISAIKMARIPDISVMPVFGKSIDLNRINAVAGGYHQLVIWLDKDAEKDAFAAATRARQFMGDTHVIVTEHDPKWYTDHARAEELLRRSIILDNPFEV